MAAEWTKAKTNSGRACIKAALYMGCYQSDLNYDDLAAFYDLPNDQTSGAEYYDKIVEYQKEFSSITECKNRKSPAGRKNRGDTRKHQLERNKFRRDLLAVPTAPDFNDDIIERVQGEIVVDDDLSQFKELYMTTCQTVLDKFLSDNPDLKPGQNYIWYKRLLIELKQNVPEVTYKDIDKLYIIWDCLTWLLNTIGLYITFEAFSLFTHVYDYQLKKMEEVNPKYGDFRKKITIERDNALVSELSYNPYNQTNKIFLAKTHGIIEKTEAKQIEVHHDVRVYDSLPMFSADHDGKN